MCGRQRKSMVRRALFGAVGRVEILDHLKARPRLILWHVIEKAATVAVGATALTLHDIAPKRSGPASSNRPARYTACTDETIGYCAIDLWLSAEERLIPELGRGGRAVDARATDPAEATVSDGDTPGDVLIARQPPANQERVQKRKS
ncbi:hypothetical protein L1887_49822 [Cichorium endivia]|nr:hypothetical protein L1887_49822 [Cichorium endivia]